MALGTQLSDVQKLIVRQGMWLAAIGSLIGPALALTGARLLKSFRYGVSASDPITFTGIAVMLLTIASSPAGSLRAASCEPNRPCSSRFGSEPWKTHEHGRCRCR